MPVLVDFDAEHWKSCNYNVYNMYNLHVYKHLLPVSFVYSMFML